MKEMQAKAWDDGGGTYGIRIKRADRAHFDQTWPDVRLRFPHGSEVSVPLSASFWRKCHEFRSPAIRDWFIKEGIVKEGGERWSYGDPPAIILTPIGERIFAVRFKGRPR